MIKENFPEGKKKIKHWEVGSYLNPFCVTFRLGEK